jgi:hypothetical protein
MSDGIGNDASLSTTIRSWSPTWAAYTTCLGALVYGAMKAYMAVEGRIGLPGFATSGATLDHIVLRQLGLVAVDLVGAVIALATVQSWGRIIPRWLLLTAVWTICVMVVAGAAGFVLGTLRPVDWTGFLGGVFLVGWAILWGATAVSYQRRSRGRHTG